MINQNETTRAHARILLDSSLKSAYRDNFTRHTQRVLYDVKIIKCGDYLQVYKFNSEKSKLDKNSWSDDEIPKISIKDVDTEDLSKTNQFKSILLSNAIRSNLNCQRICKANREEWETFITLTFSDNITDLTYANNKFHNWVSNVRKIKNDFKYVAVPEFQKRGAVHYHILSNLGISDKEIILKQKLKTGNAIKCDQLYDVRYWSYGFARVDFIKNDYKKIYSYICKYMTKDIDDRLFGKKRYFFSQNLNQPKEEFLNLSNPRDYDYFMNLIQNKSIEYNNTYKDLISNNNIDFIEYVSS